VGSLQLLLAMFADYTKPTKPQIFRLKVFD
jgi:hypothetical protein